MSNLSTLEYTELVEINGGSITLTIMGVTFVGWKAVALISAGVTTLAGDAALGFYNGSK
ncbi:MULTISPECIES: hypothetical protein [Bacillota]|uniref:Class IIb bacteriocin, lactobin A/cerein 7B family n=2 Tax=Bacillota TaxID=1239 RepID=A0A9X3XUQ8_ENTFC|nr:MULTISPECIES: hypothetical protein [Bacillota]MDC4242841.1 hypothetical protein [Clostridium tertium]MDC4249324.1 class IIb bacteriocin, lactobin A/cerein 7B family [Enterococcus faecium]